MDCVEREGWEGNEISEAKNWWKVSGVN